MIASFLIMFRESLEAVLVAGVVLGFLSRTGRNSQKSRVWAGIGAGVAASILAAVLFQLLAGGFHGRSEQLFEAVTMIAGAVLMTTAIAWMARQGSARAHLEKKVESSLSRGSSWGFFLLVFVSILREGVEAVLFLQAARFASADNNLLGAVLGLAAAALLGWLAIRAATRFNPKTFFFTVNILLVLFAAGLVAQGVHELTEAGVLPPIVSSLWDINPARRADGSFPLLHEDGAIGSALKGLFGYRGAPTLVEVLGYVAYLILAFPVWRSALTKSRQLSTI